MSVAATIATMGKPLDVEWSQVQIAHHLLLNFAR